ncbi:Hypothetical predicted protein [Marmota monax]|uniref:Uncharacterized protein n=1 Tax=Marmota monax TaxID=9995 RepID=A0A5E4D4M1_MARMO|nr:Hypothetical predicted protein [Marmota monax]
MIFQADGFPLSIIATKRPRRRAWGLPDPLPRYRIFDKSLKSWRIPSAAELSGRFSGRSARGNGECSFLA